MDHTSAAKINRLCLMEARAEARFVRAMKAGSLRWKMKAADFLTLVSSRSTAACGGEISSYR